MKKEERMIKAIGFDFDGTLILSEEDKENIAADLFEKHCGVKKGIKKFYRTMVGKGIIRRNKIKRLFNVCMKRNPTKKELDRLDKAFGREYEKRLRTCPLVGCTNILKELKKQVKFLFLLSLENRPQIMHVAKHCGISRYFDEILGGPKTKIENLKHVLRKHHIKPEEIVYVGDSKGDIIASKRLKIKSVGISKEFDYRKLLKKLGADFTFSSLCSFPYKKVIK